MLTTLLMTLWTAGAAQATVVVMPVEVLRFGDDTASLRSDVESALQNVLGPRYKRTPNGTLSCDKASCYRLIAEAQGADEIAQVKLERRTAGGFADLSVRVFDADGEPVTAITEALPERNLEYALRRVCTRAFDNASYAGTIAVRGAAEGETVLVDGVPTDTTAPRASVGEHVVTAIDAQGRERSVSVTVPFDAIGVAELPEAEVPTSAPRPLWPAVTTLVVGAAGVLLAGGSVGVIVVDLGVAGDARRNLTWGNQPLARLDPAGTEWREGYGETGDSGGLTPIARARGTAVNANLASASESAAYALLGTVAAGAAIGVAGGVGAWLLWPADQE